MALRKPLVIVGGQIEQLQSGDTLSGPFAEIEGLTQTSAEAGGIVIGTPVYSSAANTVKKAQANAAGTAKVLGFVTASIVTTGAGTVQTSGVIAATTGEWDTVAGTTGGLTFNTVYYLSKDTVGTITSTAPSAVGELVVEVGIAISTTELVINIKRPILL
jgi:hypothetical protein